MGASDSKLEVMPASSTRRTSHAAGVVQASKYWLALRKALPTLEGKVVAVTGATSGMGIVLAVTVAELRGQIIMLNRASERHDAAFDVVRAAALEAGAPEPIFIECDLSDFASTRAAGDALALQCSSSGLDVLANNAGIMAFQNVATTDGCDIQMQTNHLSHYILVGKAMAVLERAAELRGEARIVNHSSALRVRPVNPKTVPQWDQQLQQKYLEKNGGAPELDVGGEGKLDMGAGGIMVGGAWERYQQTKQANMVFTFALDERLRAAHSKVKAVVCHPGVSSSQLSPSMSEHGDMKGLGLGAKVDKLLADVLARAVMQSQEDGACGLVTASLAAGVESGTFWGPVGKASSYEYDAGGVQKHNMKEYTGPATLIPVDRVACLGGQATRDMLWAVSERTTGGTIAIARAGSTAAAADAPDGGAATGAAPAAAAAAAAAP
jgi:NAD(P)-dependent dehydrogenase (short-subunit alcohol dehydrogenase family)